MKYVLSNEEFYDALVKYMEEEQCRLEYNDSWLVRCDGEWKTYCLRGRARISERIYTGNNLIHALAALKGE